MRIHLHNNRIALIDDEDAWKVMHVKKWYYNRRKSSDFGYALGFIGHKDGDFTRPINVYLQRLIMAPPDNMQVTFKSNDTLDCRKSNLIIIPKGGSKWRQRNHVKRLGEPEPEKRKKGDAYRVGHKLFK